MGARYEDITPEILNRKLIFFLFNPYLYQKEHEDSEEIKILFVVCINKNWRQRIFSASMIQQQQEFNVFNKDYVQKLSSLLTSSDKLHLNLFYKCK